MTEILTARAFLIDGPDHETASEWAKDFIVPNQAHAWVVGRFVEAERANANNQYFSTDGLVSGKPTLTYTPMNINHNARDVVGAYVAAEVIYPAVTGEAAGEEPKPYIEACGVVWRYYFPEEYMRIKAAAAEGLLAMSMEAIPRAISTVGGSFDNEQFEYQGRVHPSYPTEINERQFPIKLHDPHFVGGALVIPPQKPAWADAKADEVASQFKEEPLIDVASVDLDADEWEKMMNVIVMSHHQD